MKATQAGFSMPEVLVASFILIWVILSSLQLTSSSILGMGKSNVVGWWMQPLHLRSKNFAVTLSATSAYKAALTPN